MKKYSLLACLLIALVFIMCQESNQAPIINSITANPDSVIPGQSTSLSVDADDRDGDALTYTWSVPSGNLSSTTGQSVSWTAPNDTGNVTINVTVQDEAGATDDASKTIKVYSNVAVGENLTSVPIYDLTTSYSNINISGVPTQAQVDSVGIVVSITHSCYSDLFIWLESPNGTEVTVWDGNYPGGIALAVTDYFKGEPVNGIWTLWVYDNYALDEGTLNSWAISILWNF